MNCAISRSLLERLRGEAGAAPGREICGLLVGRPGLIRDARPVANAASDPARGFALDPAEHLAAAREARARGDILVGHYHSHPGGRSDPSPEDARNADEQGRYWLILGAGEARLWLSRRGGAVLGAFEPVELEILAPPALQPAGATANRTVAGDVSTLAGATSA